MGLVTVKKALVKFATAYCVPRCCSADSGKSIGGSWESCGNPAATSRRAQDAHRCAAGVRGEPEAGVGRGFPVWIFSWGLASVLVALQTPH